MVLKNFQVGGLNQITVLFSRLDTLSRLLTLMFTSHKSH